MKEVDLAKPVISYLESMGWSVYQEVLIHGRIADIVAVCGKLTWIIECKTSLSLKLLEQAYAWRGHSNFISIVIPRKSYIYSSSFVDRMLNLEGIGVLCVNFSEVVENIRPKFHRKTIDIKKFLKPEHKFWAEAGSQKGYYTPFQNTKRNIEYAIKKYPDGILFKEFLKIIEHHYSTDAGARTCLIHWINSNIIKGAKIINKGNKLYIFPTTAIDNSK